MKVPRGFTLVEMLVAMMVGSVIAGLGVTLIGSLLRAEGAGRRHLAETRSLERLAKRFGADVHSASDFAAPVRDARLEGAQSLGVFRAAENSSVEYQLRGEDLIRCVSQGGALVRQEVFSLPDMHLARIVAEPSRAPRMLLLLIERSEGIPPPRFAAVRDGWSVVAELDRDSRVAGKQSLAAAEAPTP